MSAMPWTPPNVVRAPARPSLCGPTRARDRPKSTPAGLYPWPTVGRIVRDAASTIGSASSRSRAARRALRRAAVKLARSHMLSNRVALDAAPVEPMMSFDLVRFCRFWNHAGGSARITLIARGSSQGVVRAWRTPRSAAPTPPTTPRHRTGRPPWSALLETSLGPSVGCPGVA